MPSTFRKFTSTFFETFALITLGIAGKRSNEGVRVFKEASAYVAGRGAVADPISAGITVDNRGACGTPHHIYSTIIRLFNYILYLQPAIWGTVLNF